MGSIKDMNRELMYNLNKPFKAVYMSENYEEVTETFPEMKTDKRSQMLLLTSDLIVCIN
jgi:hypothetical protein